jgi:LPS export ABC transporter protein LptC
MRFNINTAISFFIFSIILLLIVSCESNFKEVQRSNLSEFTPNGEADSINLKYTDSGKIKAILVSPKMLDYNVANFPFTEFPNGINVTLFDENAKKTFVTSKYAVSYKTTNIIDLQGNVKITNETGQLLETEQLYFDQKNEWFYTEKRYKFTDPKGVSFGEGIDFSKDFKIINSQKISGEVFENP